MKKNYVWVLEKKYNNKDYWEIYYPLMSRSEARENKRYLEMHNDGIYAKYQVIYRIRKYYTEEK